MSDYDSKLFIESFSIGFDFDQICNYLQEPITVISSVYEGSCC